MTSVVSDQSHLLSDQSDLIDDKNDWLTSKLEEQLKQMLKSRDGGSEDESWRRFDMPRHVLDELHSLILDTEKNRGYCLNLGYELKRMRELRTNCSDATIKVRRLVNNFKERIEDIEKQVWDDEHKLKDDFSFANIGSSGLNDIILLHDWYACNAP